MIKKEWILACKTELRALAESSAGCAGCTTSMLMRIDTAGLLRPIQQEILEDLAVCMHWRPTHVIDTYAARNVVELTHKEMRARKLGLSIADDLRRSAVRYLAYAFGVPA